MEQTINHKGMNKLTFEEITAAMVIAQLTRKNSQKTIADVKEFLEEDINMEKVCYWLKENNIAQIAYDKHGLGCIINVGACLGSDAYKMFSKEY